MLDDYSSGFICFLFSLCATTIIIALYACNDRTKTYGIGASTRTNVCTEIVSHDLVVFIAGGIGRRYLAPRRSLPRLVRVSCMSVPTGTTRGENVKSDCWSKLRTRRVAFGLMLDVAELLGKVKFRPNTSRAIERLELCRMFSPSD